MSKLFSLVTIFSWLSNQEYSIDKQEVNDPTSKNIEKEGLLTVVVFPPQQAFMEAVRTETAFCILDASSIYVLLCVPRFSETNASSYFIFCSKTLVLVC